MFGDNQHNFGSPRSLQLLATRNDDAGDLRDRHDDRHHQRRDRPVGRVGHRLQQHHLHDRAQTIGPGGDAGEGGRGAGRAPGRHGRDVAAALLVGVFHAVLITRLGLPPFIATLGTLIGLRSLGRVIAQAQVSQRQSRRVGPRFPSLFNATWTWHIPGFELAIKVRWVPLCVFLVVAAGAAVLMKRTVLGRHLYALGGNEEAARLSGIRTDRLKYVAYCIGALCSGLAGILYAAREGQGNSTNMGMGYELNAIAAAVVGGASLRGGVGTMSGTILGALFLTLVVNGIPQHHQDRIDAVRRDHRRRGGDPGRGRQSDPRPEVRRVATSRRESWKGGAMPRDLSETQPASADHDGKILAAHTDGRFCLLTLHFHAGLAIRSLLRSFNLQHTREHLVGVFSQAAAGTAGAGDRDCHFSGEPASFNGPIVGCGTSISISRAVVCGSCEDPVDGIHRAAGNARLFQILQPFRRRTAGDFGGHERDECLAILRRAGHW